MEACFNSGHMRRCLPWKVEESIGVEKGEGERDAAVHRLGQRLRAMITRRGKDRKNSTHLAAIAQKKNNGGF